MVNTQASQTADPKRVADVTLAAAIRANADGVFIEPDDEDDACYAITFERSNEVLTTVQVDATLGAAVIARLAYIAELDLASASASSSRLPVRSGTREAEVVITVRPGGALRADIMIVPRGRNRTSSSTIPVAGPNPGDTIGNYKVTEFLGEGGMGTVYRCEHVALGREYALKVLRSKVVERDPTAAQRFLREARTAARVRHPNIVDVFDYGTLADGRPYFVMELLEGESHGAQAIERFRREVSASAEIDHPGIVQVFDAGVDADGSFYMAMELLEGESLADRVDRGALPPAEVVTIARQLATALCAAHDRGVIHADVTPSNVLVVSAPASTEMHVKLVDFGLAELAGEAMQDENPEFVLGTPAYISPEQLRGLAPTDRSDQYGLGAVIFELLVGHPPYQHPDLRTLCMMHITAPIPPVESPHGPLPPKLADVVTTCLQKTPQSRFPGMRALIAALDEIERVTDRRGWRRWLSS
jgi:serine/threonine protein kinase